jgi:hypothetical protein
MLRIRKIEAAVLSLLACVAFAAAAQRQSLKIVPDPSVLGVRAQSDPAPVRVDWVQLSGVGSQTPAAQPLTGEVYYAAVPAGGDLSKYTKIISVDDNAEAVFSEGVTKRVTRFVPGRQGGRMGPGVYYIIVASVSGTDTLYSDYLTLRLASSDPPAIVFPRADVMKGESVKRVTDLAPIFTWSSVPGVPYYHVVLSDVPFFDANGNFNEDANIIWQAITPNTRIAYGAPDPSKTTAVAPPPLSPGTVYSWMVLNNYGNYPAFTSWNVVNAMNGIAGKFFIDAGGLAAPNAVSPEPGRIFSDGDQITLKWNNLDGGANSYLVNLFKEGRTGEFGMGGMGDYAMNMLVWETTVSRGAGSELSVSFNAAGTLTAGKYKWRVYALDGRGAASTDSVASMSTFIYNKTSDGVINVKTVETIGDVNLPVGFVELGLEVVSGPAMAAPPLFHTDSAGVLNRSFPAGTYRISAVKEGYPRYTSTITVAPGSRPTAVIIPMRRAEAVLYGKVIEAANNSAVSAAKVTAVSLWGDTVSAATDGGGNFVLACRAADWTVTAEKPGFGASASKRVTLSIGQNRDFGAISLNRNPAALSGVVKNSVGEPVVAARVRVLRDGALIDELASTPQNGAYVFYLNPGTYTVTAERPGFAMFSRSVFVTGTMSQNITLREGAVLVSGVITGSAWVAGAGAGGGYVNAPITSARVTFAESGVAAPDTFTVTSDPVFGKFSASLPIDRVYDVTVAAPGFGSSEAGRRFTTDAADGELSKTYADTLYALAAIKGRVTDLPDDLQADVIVFGAEGRIVASVQSVGGAYELRNIPDGNFTVRAGAIGYFTRDSYQIAVTRGRPSGNASGNYIFEMEPGDKSVRFKADGNIKGSAVRVVSPINRTIFFNNDDAGEAVLDNVGSGDYVVEAVPADSTRLELGYHKFDVPENSAVHTETLRFPFTYATSDTVMINHAGAVDISWPQSAGNLYSPINRVTLYYRSEGAVRFDSLSKTPDFLEPFSVVPARDGCNLYYYFRVYLENGDIYGSGKQLYRWFVRPDIKAISRVTVEPGAVGGDTLVLPSSYQTKFTFRAFFGDRFMPVDSGNISKMVTWTIEGANSSVPITPIPGPKGVTYSYFTPEDEQDLRLRASFTPANGYTMRDNVPSAVDFPIRITGKALKSMRVLRKGEAGPILSNESVGFRVDAFDGDGKQVAVSPQWSVYPPSAAVRKMDSDGVFTPDRKFVGMARIEAAAGGLTAEYTEPGASVPGQRVKYVLNPDSGETADTKKGMRIVFKRGSVRKGANANLDIAVPKLTNIVQIGTEDYRIADSIAFDLTFSDVGAIADSVVLSFDIPEQFKDAAKDGGYEFRVARWFPDSSLRWIPIPVDAAKARVDGVVSAVLLPAPVEGPSLAKRKKASAQQASRASTIAVSARYALVVKASKTSLAMSVSPHPFSPYIVPVKEYGSNAKAGTCIKVNVQAREPFVKSVKVRVHNATGKMVWGVEKLGAQTGETRFWWNGRTSGGSGASVGEESWSEDYYERNANRPMCRNGRYYVMVIVTDMEGKQRRAMKPLVLMK